MQLQIFEEDLSIADLESKAARCTLCSLSQYNDCGYGVAFFDGSCDAQIMAVAEGPGAKEISIGKPLVGKAGKLFNQILAYAGFKRSDFYVTNVVKHRPLNNRTPTPEESKTCSDYFLRREVDIIDPKIILAFGNVAMGYFLGDPSGITKQRGKWFERDGRLIMPVLHPAYLLRNPIKGEGTSWNNTATDILKVREKALELGVMIDE